MMYLDRASCFMILLDAGVDVPVLKHTEAVLELAREICHCAGGHSGVVTAGALLHDVGRCVSHGVDHAVKGADILRERNVPEDVVLCVERHIGAGIPPERAKELGLPDRNYMPETLEQKIIAHADNLIAGSNRQTIGDYMDHMEKKGLPEASRLAKELHDELSGLCGYDLDEICSKE